MNESDLYQPLKTHFENQGCEVQAEVKHCDMVVTTPEGGLMVVELKTSVNLSLLIQATERQSISEHVYIAIPKKSYRRKQWQGIQRVVKQLGLGLLVVSISPLTSLVTEHFSPVAMRKTNKRKRAAIHKEVKDRIGSYNTGGSTGKELMTAYKQNAIIIACFLEVLGPSSAAHLRKLGNPTNTRSILADNHYGWFKKIERGVYDLDEKVAEGHEKYPELWRTARELVNDKLAVAAD